MIPNIKVMRTATTTIMATTVTVEASPLPPVLSNTIIAKKRIHRGSENYCIQSCFMIEYTNFATIQSHFHRSVQL